MEQAVLKDKQLTLGDVGEFRIINEIILPKLNDVSVSTPLGDDCAFADLSKNGKHIVVTSDLTPRPLIWELGYKSYYAWGWYSVLSNISDLATAGADPVAFTTSIEASASMAVSDLNDFFSGLRDACREIGVPNAGGNLNEGQRFACHGTAIGMVPAGKKISRRGMSPGDAIYIIGESGFFISLYLKARTTGLDSLTDSERDRLVKPNSLIHLMRNLRDADVLSAASDNSDGILGALWNLAERSDLGIEINLGSNMLAELVVSTASAEHVNPWNLFFFWGDWQQVVAVKRNSISEFESIISKEKTHYTYLGTVLDQPAVLYGELDGQRRKINLIRNENFRPYSYNNTAGGSLEYMLHASLFESPGNKK